MRRRERTGSRTRYARSVAAAAKTKTQRREIAYESRAARCRCGGSCATSVDECRILVIHCDACGVSEARRAKRREEACLLGVGVVDALVQLAGEDRLEEGRGDGDAADLADSSEELTEAGADSHSILCSRSEANSN